MKASLLAAASLLFTLSAKADHFGKITDYQDFSVMLMFQAAGKKGGQIEKFISLRFTRLGDRTSVQSNFSLSPIGPSGSEQFQSLKPSTPQAAGKVFQAAVDFDKNFHLDPMPALATTEEELRAQEAKKGERKESHAWTVRIQEGPAKIEFDGVAESKILKLREALLAAADPDQKKRFEED